MNKKMIDVSIVLNCHRESIYLKRTYLSLIEAVNYAKKQNINCELIFVLDRSDDATKSVAKEIDEKFFVQVKFIEVDFGDAGLSRDAGTDVSQGKYIWFCDGDDLCSYDSVSINFNLAEQDDCVVIPEYLISFGNNQEGFTKYFGSEVFGPLALVNTHPFISKIFIRRSLLKEKKIRHIPIMITKGFAYEDYWMNCEILGNGIKFKVASKTIHFYRRRNNGVFRTASSISEKEIPHSVLFEKKKIINLFGAKHDKQTIQQANHNPKEEVFSSPECLLKIAEAVKIDSSINVHKLYSSQISFTNIVREIDWGYDLPTAFKIAGLEDFTDIVILPFLTRGGADKYVIDLISSLSTQTAKFKCLLISGQSIFQHAWLDKIPKNSVFLDVYHLFPYLTDSDRQRLVLRLILAYSKKPKETRLYVKYSPFATSFFSRFNNILTQEFTCISLRFSDPVAQLGSYCVKVGEVFDFNSTHINEIDKVITDNKSVLENDLNLLGDFFRKKYQCLYAHIPSKSISCDPKASFSLIWASRIDKEKRYHILPKIVKKIRTVLPNFTISVFGDLYFQSENALDQFKNIKGLFYKGGFDSFDSLNPHLYDALVFTSYYEGMPNIILEAMSFGLPVIAPDVGGISEAVKTGETGYLLPNEVDDNKMVGHYVKTILDFYANWEKNLAMRQNAFALIKSRHDSLIYQENVARIFELPPLSGEDKMESSNDIDSLQAKVSELEQQLNEERQRNIALNHQLVKISRYSPPLITGGFAKKIASLLPHNTSLYRVARHIYRKWIKK
jgi:glycosyltransferase involved in cell wall biosynthesis